MRDEPGGADLLRTARETLLAEVLPALQGAQRYQALMVANALGMVERELVFAERLRAADRAAAAHAGQKPDDLDAAARASCAAIRAGRFDGDERLHAALRRRAILAVAITRPDALTATERQEGEQAPRP